MAAGEFLDVDPRTLRVPPSRPQGADPAKLQRQIAKFGRSATGMPPPWVYRGTDKELLIYNGVTRATRIAKLAPGTLIQVEVVGDLSYAVGHNPTVGDVLP
ncbi:MAG: hypothetical protein C5B58_05195 [Acidobacteria bacterium]|nr:MAG: hypothetical protein C5B58_05195 [Acidobacteriota bacterium]